MFKSKPKLSVSEPGINIKFGLEASYFPSHGKIIVGDKKSEMNNKNIDFFIIEPFRLPNVLNENIINMIFNEAKRQDINIVGISEYRDRLFKDGNELSNDPYIELKDSSNENYPCDVGVRVVRSDQMNENPYTVVYKLSDKLTEIPSVTPKFLSKLFSKVRNDRFIPISLECVLFNKEQEIDSSLDTNTSIDTQMIVHPKSIIENMDIPAVIRKRKK